MGRRRHNSILDVGIIPDEVQIFGPEVVDDRGTEISGADSQLPQKVLAFPVSTLEVAWKEGLEDFKGHVVYEVISVG